MSSDGQYITEGGSALRVEPQEIWHALRRRKWWIILSTLLVGGLVGFGTYRQPKVYEAVSKIVIDPSLPNVLGPNIAVDDLTERVRAERVFNNTQYRTMTSRAVLGAVADRLRLAERRDFRATYGLAGIEGEELEKKLYATLSRMVRVDPETGSRIVDLVVEDRDPSRAAEIANALAAEYIDYSLEQRLKTTREASVWLDKRVAELARELEGAEQKLHDFKKSNTLVSVSLEDRQNMTGASLAILNTKMVEAQTRLIELKARRDVLQSITLDPDAAAETLPGAATHPVIVELRTALVSLGKTRAELSTRYGDKHPKMLALEKQLTDNREQLTRELDLIVQSVDREIEGLEATLGGLRAAMAAQKQDALALNNLGLDYSKLTRDFGTTRTIYESLLKRGTEADLSKELKSNFVREFQRAETGLQIRPSVPKNTAIGLAIGLAIGVLGAIGLLLLDNTIHGQSDIERFLKLPFLGVLPRLEDDGSPARSATYSRERDLYIADNPQSAAAECARSVRTNLLFMGTGTDRPLRCLLLTSAGPAEGKTTTAVGLGVAMAQAGNSVLLIDTDLRKPRLHQTFGVPGDTGVTNLLIDDETAALEQEIAAEDEGRTDFSLDEKVSEAIDQAIKKVIRSTAVTKLDVLPCGTRPPQPAELLHSARFRGVLRRLLKKYDRVLLDSPPAGLVTDAAILAQHVDGSILVVQANKTSKDAVRRAHRRLASVDAKVVGVVLNDFDVKASPDGGHDYYYYHKSYGYGAEAEDKA